MEHVNATQLYINLKKSTYKYNEETHCPMVIKVFSEKGTVAQFCKIAGISDNTLYQWTKKYPLFKDCFRLAKMIAQANWEKEPEEAGEDFNYEVWRLFGAMRYGVGNNINRVRIEVDEDASPYEQYKQLMQQASCGDFTSSEIKQIMESINVGVRVYETFKLQEEVDTMKNDLDKIKERNGNNSSSVEKA